MKIFLANLARSLSLSRTSRISGEIPDKPNKPMTSKAIRHPNGKVRTPRATKIRSKKARSRNKGGNGLGLSIAHRLVEGYHGSISVESVEGQGSVFKVQLPLVKDVQKGRCDKT